MEQISMDMAIWQELHDWPDGKLLIYGSPIPGKRPKRHQIERWAAAVALLLENAATAAHL